MAEFSFVGAVRRVVQGVTEDRDDVGAAVDGSASGTRMSKSRLRTASVRGSRGAGVRPASVIAGEGHRAGGAEPFDVDAEAVGRAQNLADRARGRSTKNCSELPTKPSSLGRRGRRTPGSSRRPSVNRV